MGLDCGVLDLRPATKDTGYNLTSQGTSSWGSKIIRDPRDRRIFHAFTTEFTHECGLNYWSPYSRIVHTVSISGPEGPYHFESEIVGTFAHNPTVVWSEADQLYLLYHIGCLISVPDTCQAVNFTCGPGNNLNGESGISVLSSPDLYRWKPHGQVLTGNVKGKWDTDTTNPSVLPLWSPHDQTSEILLVYRGCGFNCDQDLEQIGVSSAPHFTGPYKRTHSHPVIEEDNEDPFIWRDKRGNYHMLLHSLEPDGGFGDGPKVGRHAYARSWEGPWTWNNNTLAYNTSVDYTDGTTINFSRRERPQLFFSEDGQMTPLFLTNGVQEKSSPRSYTIVQPIGDGAARYVKSLGV